MQHISLPPDSLAPVVLFLGRRSLSGKVRPRVPTRSNKKYRRGTPQAQEVALVPEGTDELGTVRSRHTGTLAHQAKAGGRNRCMSHHYLSGFITMLIPRWIHSLQQYDTNALIQDSRVPGTAVLLGKSGTHLWETSAWQANPS